jgi:hypothetical protein
MSNYAQSQILTAEILTSAKAGQEGLGYAFDAGYLLALIGEMSRVPGVVEFLEDRAKRGSN